MHNYKNTLNLPFTKFSMRGFLTKKEPKILEKWEKKNLYSIIRNKKKANPSFILQDGPPYANGNIHLGHAVNKILKDIVIKSKNMSNFDAPFDPCWDCHGLPIEHQVEKILKKEKKNISKDDFRKICAKYAKKQVAIQKKDFIKLGILANWDNPYLTMDKKNESNTIKSLSQFIKNKYIYQGFRPVHWCIDCNSALADTELEYVQTTSPSITVLFQIKNTDILLKKYNFLPTKNKKIFAVVWTTTPWTLPSNQAISVHPNLNYQLVETLKYRFIIEKNTVKELLNKINIKKWIVNGEIKGVDLEYIKFIHPFLKITVPMILNKNIEKNTGTGIVHIAPDHGYDDYIIAQKYNIKIKNLVNEHGLFVINTHPLLDNINVFKANSIIIEILSKTNNLILSESIQHSYPCCWRHKTKIIFRATPQWFIKINDSKLQDQAKLSIDKSEWCPNWGKNRTLNLLSQRPDWCISRQRTWGVPIPIFIHKKTKEMHPNTLNLLDQISEEVKKQGIEFWWNLKKENLLKEDSKDYIKVLDILDVWFESGSIHIKDIYPKKNKFNNQKADLCIEGSDQYRGWFMSSLIVSSINSSSNFFKKIISHGFTIDDQGKKMSKSLGNIISPNTIVNTMGADILRLWVASTDYSKDIVISDIILKQICESYRKIRNTIRFLIANLYDFCPKKHFINKDKSLEIDKWIINLTKETQKKIINFYENYQFHNVTATIIHFCSIEISSFYLDITKDRLYTSHKKSLIRKSAQTAIYLILQTLVRWISPILSFTADEIWDFVSKKDNDSIFTKSWFTELYSYPKNNTITIKSWNIIIQIRNEINKILEIYREKKIIHNSLESHVLIYVNCELYKILNVVKRELKFIFLVSKVNIYEYSLAPKNIDKNKKINQMKLVIKKIVGLKCPRCWHYYTNKIIDTINFTQPLDLLCQRCSNTINNLHERRQFF
ncbi:Isoleucine--tRNA ligase [Buchnera aphidicola (Thelaxes suberi)]|uniref:isoleucine--tRNA ligase n=1 Tax=Buchnera aphidicola TaxID=9 RepID=UPI0034646A28